MSFHDTPPDSGDGSFPGSDDSWKELFGVWFQRGKEATSKGDFAAALDSFQNARIQAEYGDVQEKLDAADINISMALLQSGRAREGEDGLREIYLRTTDARMAFTAAFNIGSSLRKQGRFEGALKYAARARDLADSLDSPEFLAVCHNLYGNIFLNQSYLDLALREYKKSMTLRESLEGDNRHLIALLLENIGYCLILRKNYSEGIKQIHKALTLAEQTGDRRCRTECLQDLCYGLLLQGNNIEALRYGALTLDESIDAGYRDIEENCHYLLGELGTKTGDDALRDEHFQKLQDQHPDLPFLREFLCTVDVTNIITLKR